MMKYLIYAYYSTGAAIAHAVPGPRPRPRTLRMLVLSADSSASAVVLCRPHAHVSREYM